MEFFYGLLDGSVSLADLIRWGGYLVLVAIVFCETGLLVGFFLPGDSLLITAGLVAAAGSLDIWLLNLLLIPAAIIGDSVGYAIGYRAGPRLFTKEQSLLFSRKHLLRTREFYEKYGGKTIVLARFIPLLRTFAPVVAGIGQMQYRRFLFYNVFGGVLWVASLTWAGYLLGTLIPDISRYIHIVVLVVILLSMVPVVVELWKARRRAPAVKP
ncbi:MAG TPA: VTT domain-containing protein [Pseudomonadales bacterium]|nr:VTT domain-containing protein [Pseudomonadales bacterium]